MTERQECNISFVDFSSLGYPYLLCMPPLFTTLPLQGKFPCCFVCCVQQVDNDMFLFLTFTSFLNDIATIGVTLISLST